MELDLDKLRAVRVLGRGAMGTVFLVVPRSPPDQLQTDDDAKLPPLFALKVFEKRSDAAKRPDADRRARWELAVLSRLSSASGGTATHPFLPFLIGSVETSDLLAWAIPFCPGGDLHRLRHSLSPDAAFSPAAIRFYLSELVSAIAHLHSLRIAYRDLKPENILLQSSGHITLTDFDLSRYLPPRSSPSSSSSSSPANLHSSPSLHRSTLPPPPSADANHRHRRHRRNLTRIFAFGGGGATSKSAVESYQHSNHHLLHLKKARSARVSPVSRRKQSFSACDAGSSSGAECERSFSFVGTEEYVSPEVVRGEGHEFAVDWWALGILTYEMAYGRTPFRGRNRKETFRNVLTRAPEFVGRRRTDLTDLIERLLAKDPTRRLGFTGGAEEVKSHPFFHGVRWDLLADVTRPPFLAPVEDLEEEVMGPGGYGTAEGFDVRDYLKGLQQPQATPSTLPSSESLGEF